MRRKAGKVCTWESRNEDVREVEAHMDGSRSGHICKNVIIRPHYTTYTHTSDSPLPLLTWMQNSGLVMMDHPVTSARTRPAAFSDAVVTFTMPRACKLQNMSTTVICTLEKIKDQPILP